MKRVALLLTIAVATAACSQKTESVQPVTQSAAAPTAAQAPVAVSSQPMPAAAAQTAAAAPTSSGAFSGKVVATMNAAGYTYLKLETPAGEKWAAVRETPVKKGQIVTVNVQMIADKFESKTLKRTFDKIAFGEIAGAPAAAPGGMMSSSQMPPGHPGMQGGGMNAMGTPQQHMSAPDIAAIKVPKAEGADARTIGEVWSSRAALADKPVVIRGKVVKSLSGIMGKNWLHLRDGSGSEGTDDITVTTNDRANVGDVVTVKGVLRVDKDFGAGYKYAVIVENATVTK